MSPDEIKANFYRVQVALSQEKADYESGNKTYFNWKFKDLGYHNELHNLYLAILQDNHLNDKTYQEDYHEINY